MYKLEIKTAGILMDIPTEKDKESIVNFIESCYKNPNKTKFMKVTLDGKLDNSVYIPSNLILNNLIVIKKTKNN
jgi:hypothetical protein|nr:MAG TPA: hypothetical protein [Caudoviricetes sp.]